MNNAWPVLIGSLVQIKETLSKVDGGLWPYHYPQVGASEAQVRGAEEALGLSFPDSYREFLKHANGWKGFFQAIDLLSCEQLVAGECREYFEATYGALDEAAWRSFGLDRTTTLPFGVTLQDRDVFVFDTSRYQSDEWRIVWLAGEKIDEWTDFPDFFKSMIEYNRREIEHFSHS